MSDPLEQPDAVRDMLQAIARALKETLPPKTGFILLAAPFDEGEVPSGRLNYVSNIERADAVKLLKEWLKKAGREEGWMRHIE